MKRRLRRTVAMAAALLLLTGCGATSAQTTTQSVPESEAAKFGNKVVDMLNGGKAKELFDLWEGSDEEVTQGLAAAVAPDAKAKGIKWEYKSGDFGAQEGAITLDYTIGKNKDQVEFKTTKVNGEWRLQTRPFAEIVACAPAAVDGFDAPIVDDRGDGKLPCDVDEMVDGSGTEGQVLLVLPGTHKFNFQGLDGIFKQPYEAMVYPVGFDYIPGAVAVCNEQECKQGFSEHYSNIIPSDLTIKKKEAYVEAVKKALIESVDCSDGCSGSDGYRIDYQPIVFNDDLTVTPSDDPLKPTLGGTAQISTEDTSKTISVADLDISLTISGTAISSDVGAGVHASVKCDDACEAVVKDSSSGRGL